MPAESPELQSQTAMKLATAKQKKDTGDQAFKEGNAKAGECGWLIFSSFVQSITPVSALMSYHEVTATLSLPLSNGGVLTLIFSL
jgi:hypothetical protein